MNVAEKKVRFIPPDTLIGKRIQKMDAPEKASGKTRYIHDIDLPGQLNYLSFKLGFAARLGLEP